MLPDTSASLNRSELLDFREIGEMKAKQRAVERKGNRHRMKICSLKELTPNTPHFVEINGVELMVSRDASGVKAFTSVCKHQGAALSEGPRRGEWVECPWHGCEWNIATGQMKGAPNVRLKEYTCRIEGEDVCAVLE